jgi:hypothetical protein
MRAVHCGNLGCECACHRQKVRRSSTKATPEQDATIGNMLARGRPIRFIASALSISENAVRWRIRVMDRSTREGWRSRDEVAKAIGVSWRRLKRWQLAGLVTVSAHGARWTRVSDADLEAFVATYAGLLFDPLGVRDPRLRRLAETSGIANQRRAV